MGEKGKRWFRKKMRRMEESLKEIEKDTREIMKMELPEDREE